MAHGMAPSAPNCFLIVSSGGCGSYSIANHLKELSDQIQVFHHWDYLDHGKHFARYQSESEALLALARSSSKVCGSVVGWVSREELDFCDENGFATAALIRDPVARALSLFRIYIQEMPSDVLTIGPAHSPKVMNSTWSVVENVYRLSKRNLWEEVAVLKKVKTVDKRHQIIWARYQFAYRFLYNIVQNDFKVIEAFDQTRIYRFEDITGSSTALQDFILSLVPRQFIDAPEPVFSKGLLSMNRRSREIGNDFIFEYLEEDMNFLENCVAVIIEAFRSHGHDLPTMYGAFGYDPLASASSLLKGYSGS